MATLVAWRIGCWSSNSCCSTARVTLILSRRIHHHQGCSSLIISSSIPHSAVRCAATRSSSSMAAGNAGGQAPFSGYIDRYKCMHVDTSVIALPDPEFESVLQGSLSHWEQGGIRATWFKLNLQQATYVPILVKYGFTYHHAKKDYVMMANWFPKDEPANLPPYPHTFIGVAGLVVNDKNQILTIQEKYHLTPHWKLPGGYAEPGEDFGETAKREVFEETGIACEFVSLVAFGHRHGHLFGCSDMYIICHLRPLSTDITQCKREIAKAQWMDVEEYRSKASDMNRFFLDSFLKNQKAGIGIGISSVMAVTKQRVNVFSIQQMNSTVL